MAATSQIDEFFCVAAQKSNILGVRYQVIMEARNLLDEFSQERGIPKSQSMDYSLDPCTQTYLRNLFVMQQNPLPSIPAFVVPPIPSRPVSLPHHSPQPVQSNRAPESSISKGNSDGAAAGFIPSTVVDNEW
ncbi:hypothetical protein R1flu_016917 [Riccia fluitans]|uniref:Uncharacterized protein n=1 Tax=Riccia fluitans TaxID=41844 RepID=A0ABD1YN87_9MARC